MLRRTGALDRYSGARSFFRSGSTVSTIWWLGALIVLVAAMGVLAWFALKHMLKRRDWNQFRQASRKAGLRQQEFDLLKKVAQSAGVKNSATVFTADGVFEEGVTRLMQSSKVAALPSSMQAKLVATFSTMREKLGLRQPLPRDESVALNSTRQIAAGSKLYITSQTGAEAVAATVFGNGPAEFLVEADALPEIRPGDVWVIRYFREEATWEFDAPVLRDEQGKAALGHSGDIRPINLRRFARVETNATARAACFSFHAGDPRQETPEFFPATLVEIAGPGLVLESSLQAAAGQRVLVVVKFDGQRQVQGLAKVRRVSPGREGATLLAVELVGLDDDEIAELARETNLAASRRTPNGAVVEEAMA